MKTALLALILVTGCAGARSPALKWAMNDELADAGKMVQSGQFRQAVDELTMLIEMSPKNEPARFLRALAYQNLEEFPLAIEDYEEILRLNPASAKAHYNLGMIFSFKAGNPHRALTHFDRFLSLEPEHARALSVAKIMCSLDDPRGSESMDGQVSIASAVELPDPAQRRRQLMTLVERLPESPLPHYLIGKTFEEERNEEEAIRSYEAALEIRPTCAACHTALGQLLQGRHKKAEAELHFAKARLFEQSDTASFDGAPFDPGRVTD